MNTSRIMLWVLAMLLPGLTAMTYVWGPGVLWNVAILSLASVLIEAALVYAQGKGQWSDIYFQLSDYTALLSAWLIAICLPPYTAPAILCLAAAGAIGLAKHAYGGLGRNVFNPAMVGYAIILVSFPQNLAHWPLISGASVDALSGATLMSEFRYRQGLTAAEFSQLFAPAASAQLLITVSFLIPGLLLVYKGLVAWRIPASMFAAIGACALIGYDQGSSVSLGSPWFHWTSGGFMAATFFVASDPVTHPRQPRQQLVFGCVIGVVIYVVRAFGGYPDGIAFAVLFANCLTPLLNRAPNRASAVSHG